MAVDGAPAVRLLDRVGNDNAKGEYYLTDIVALARADGLACGVVEGAEDELIGVNSRVELAAAEAIVQDAAARPRRWPAGATLIDPATRASSATTPRSAATWWSGRSSSSGPASASATASTIRSFCHLEGVQRRRRAR